MILLVAAMLTCWLVSIWCALSVSRARGLVRKAQQCLGVLVFGGLSLLLTGLFTLVQAFDRLGGETLVARITTRRLPAQAFELTYLPAGPEVASPVRVRLRGDQWSISGGFVKWHPWLALLGVPSYHKPLRLSGQFSSIEQQRASPPAIYVLEPSGDRLWEVLYKADPYLPFIEAVYGSSAYVYVEPMREQEVYVTPSGYLIKRGKRLDAR